MTTTSTAQPVSLTRYFAAEGSRFSNKDAQILGPWLRSLARPGMKTTDEQIVQAARPADSPGHPYFEWDDARAGSYYRRLQAQNMKRAIQFEIVGSSGQSHRIAVVQTVPVTAVDPRDGRKNDRGLPIGVLVATESVRAAPQQREEILRRCYAEVRAFKRKLGVYRDILETPAMRSLFEALDAVEVEAQTADAAK